MGDVGKTWTPALAAAFRKRNEELVWFAGCGVSLHILSGEYGVTVPGARALVEKYTRRSRERLERMKETRWGADWKTGRALAGYESFRTAFSGTS